MSYLGPRPDQSTTAEVSLLTALNNLGISGANESIQKTGVDSFANVAAAGTGTVTSVSVTTANGISGSVATATSTPAITLSLGAITPTSVVATGSVTGSNLSGTNTGDNAANSSSTYIGTTAVALNRTSAALTLAGITLTAPVFDTSITGSYLTASEILITDGSKNIVSAAVATYPSLTELTYVKGVTSAIQTQLGTKQATITFGTGAETALGVNVGSAGAFVVLGGALGTPSSGTGTNITGIPAANILAGSLGTGAYVMDSSLQVSTIELGHATDTTLARVSAGLVSIEGANIMTVSSADTVTGVKTLGTTGAIKLGSAVTDKCEIRLNDSALNDETWSGTVIDATLGATIAVGDVCYLQTSDGRWELVDGILDGTDVGFKLKLGICLVAGNDGSATKILLDGLIASAAFPAFTVGAPVYLSDTAGDLIVAQPSTTNFAIRVVGEAVSATVLHFHPSNDYVVYL